MKKRTLAAVLCVFFMLGLISGCSKSNGGGKESGSTSKVVADRIENAKKTGKYQKVVMAFLNYVGAPSGLKDVEAEINKQTEKTLGLDVQLNILDAATYKQQLTLMLSSGEQLDIYNTVAVGYVPSINNGYTLDLEKDGLISTYGQGILKTLDQSYIDACRVGGVLYGLPNQRDMAQGVDCCAVGSKYLDGIGYDYKSKYKNADDEIIHTDLGEINDIFSKLHQKYPDQAVIFPTTNTTQQLDFDALGGDNFGVLLNGGTDLKVQDLFSSESYMNYCERYYQWNKAGYISKDAMTNNIAATEQVKSGATMAYPTGGKPGIKAQESGLTGQPMVIFQLGKDLIRSASISGMTWCINSGSKDPVAAMQFLNAAYTDATISNLLCWGVEGKEYKVTGDGHIDFADGVNASNSPYFNNVNWEMPNQFIAHIFVGDDLKIWDRMKKFNSEATKSKAVGFTFDSTSVSSEYTALANIYDQYQKQLEYGFTDPKVGIPEMVGKMKTAGLEKYMEAKQKQLDDWTKTAEK